MASISVFLDFSLRKKETLGTPSKYHPILLSVPLTWLEFPLWHLSHIMCMFVYFLLDKKCELGGDMASLCALLPSKHLAQSTHLQSCAE